ncbi:hypothetical protein M5K25_015746 [Dendrobium thyrsiflorum]|uniref:Uncharacterized protein n=1 Tax=Dendrobium thyrsiflorum TaxID=117978 RepID=A0ABD0UR30_DENTH
MRKKTIQSVSQRCDTSLERCGAQTFVLIRCDAISRPLKRHIQPAATLCSLSFVRILERGSADIYTTKDNYCSQRTTPPPDRSSPVALRPTQLIPSIPCASLPRPVHRPAPCAPCPRPEPPAPLPRLALMWSGSNHILHVSTRASRAMRLHLRPARHNPTPCTAASGQRPVWSGRCVLVTEWSGAEQGRPGPAFQTERRFRDQRGTAAGWPKQRKGCATLELDGTGRRAGDESRRRRPERVAVTDHSGSSEQASQAVVTLGQGKAGTPASKFFDRLSCGRRVPAPVENQAASRRKAERGTRSWRGRLIQNLLEGVQGAGAELEAQGAGEGAQGAGRCTGRGSEAQGMLGNQLRGMQCDRRRSVGRMFTIINNELADEAIHFNGAATRIQTETTEGLENEGGLDHEIEGKKIWVAQRIKQFEGIVNVAGKWFGEENKEVVNDGSALIESGDEDLAVNLLEGIDRSAALKDKYVWRRRRRKRIAE